MMHHIEENQINEEIIKNSDKLVLIDFFADWCVPCQMLTPILQEIDKKYKDIEVYKINTDESSNANIIYGITSVPTVVFLKNKEEVERVVGLQPYEKISKIIEDFKE